MSEFISICPKCHQQILGDTEYIGKRVACPVCLQEITMPEPQAPAAGHSPPPTPVTAPTPALGSRSTTPPPAAGGKSAFQPKKKSSSPVIAIGISAGVLALAGVVVFFAMPKSPTPATPPPPAQTATTAPKPVATAPKTTVGLPNCRAFWTFDDSGGSIATDRSGTGHNAILSGRGANWSNEAKVGAGSLSLTRDSYAQASGPVVNTAESFTAAVWVKFDTMTEGNNQTMLSIDGQNVSAFYLQLHSRNGVRKLTFDRHPSDDVGTTPILAIAPTDSRTGIWYHVAGVYDAKAKTMSLYVDGHLQQTVPCPSGWEAKGDTAIGRGVYNGKNVDFVYGLLDDARIYNVALKADQIEALTAGRTAGQ
jgi:hypothetical protein